MADQWSGGQNGAGERWAVNLPAVIGVVFVFLVGVIVWVIASSGDGDDTVATGSSPSTTSFPPVSSVETTTPLPMPSTTLVPPTAAPTVVAAVLATLPPTVAPVATAPPTAAPTPAPTAAPLPPPPPPPTTTQATTTQAPTTLAPATPAPTTTTAPSGDGDLGVPGLPMMHPPCDGGFITVLGSAIGSQATAESMKALLDRYATSNYLRTDMTCSSLTPSSNGQPIYVIYFGPFATDTEACAKRTDGPKDAYVRMLSNEVGPDHSVKCK